MKSGDIQFAKVGSSTLILVEILRAFVLLAGRQAKLAWAAIRNAGRSRCSTMRDARSLPLGSLRPGDPLHTGPPVRPMGCRDAWSQGTGS
jgi:hypothetical protein